MRSTKVRAARPRAIGRSRAGASAAIPEALAPWLSPTVQVERSVLVVEADPDVQVQIARSLRAHGHRVVGTSSGDGALALLTEWAVDLALVSQDLPGPTGVEVTRKLREKRPEVPIVLMVSAAESTVREAACRAGAAGCVLKPFAFQSLSPWLGPPVLPRLSVTSHNVRVAE